MLIDVKQDRYVFIMDQVEVHAILEARHLRNALHKELSIDKPDWVLVSAEDPSQTLYKTALSCLPDNVIYLAHTPQMLPFGEESLFPGKVRSELLGKARAIVTISEFVSDLFDIEYGAEHFHGGVIKNHPPHYGKDFLNIGSFRNEYVLLINPCAVKGISIFIELVKGNPDVSFAVVSGWGTTSRDMAELKTYNNVTI